MLIYLASPYSHPDADVRLARWRAVCLAAARLMEDAGCTVFSPIAHSHPIAEFGGLAHDHDFWFSQNETFLRLCDKMVILKLEGWQESHGVLAETAFMKGLNKPITYLDPRGAGL